ncbi:MAG: cation transporter [Deltaproteobacteria bacterium]|jgi:cation diffusion facilitator family transporter|nr:cation transporter [Deltaproteobacteria bacterium]
MQQSAHDMTDREQQVRKVTWIGLGLNLFLSTLKLAAGYFGKSQALIADAIHSLSDTTSDIAVIAGSHYWSRPPDESHPYGHRRMETLVSIFIGIMLLAAGAGIGWEAIISLRQKQGAPPGWIALVAAFASIVSKEIIYRWTAAAGRRVKSSALAANAWHHRTDAISSLPVFVAVGGALIFPSWSFLDRVGAVIVSIFILHAAIRIIWPGISELIDVGAPEEIQNNIKACALKSNGVLNAHAIRTRYISTSIQVDLHIVVDGSMTVREGHAIADDVRDCLIEKIPDVVDVVVHVDPPEAIRKAFATNEIGD